MLECDAPHLCRLPLLLHADRGIHVLRLHAGTVRREREREPRIGTILGGQREIADVQGGGIGAQQHMAEILGLEEADVHRRPGKILLRARRVVAADVQAERAELGHVERVGKGGERDGHLRQPLPVAHPRRHGPVGLPVPLVNPPQAPEIALRALGVEDELVERIADAEHVQEDFDGVAEPARVARSADWIATEYANQSSPATFATASDEERLPYGTLLSIR